MAKKKDTPLSSEEESVLDTPMGAVEFDPNQMTSAAALANSSLCKNERLPGEAPKKVPDMSDPEWSDFVMSHFRESELDPNGRPLVHGLRRVVRLLLGPIIASRSHVVQAPSIVPGSERLTLLQPAVVEFTVDILMCRLENGLSEPYQMSFTNAADCYFGNLPDPEFARYLTATATTRAEGRALRNALQLNIITADEASTIPALEASVDGYITPEGINFINIICCRLNINVLKFINAGKKRYARIEDIPYAVAQNMVECLSGYQNDKSRIPPGLLGYEKNWRDS